MAIKRQKIITLSSKEAKYIPLSSSGKDVLHVRRPFKELQINGPIKEEKLEPTTVNKDSYPAIFIGDND